MGRENKSKRGKSEMAPGLKKKLVKQQQAHPKKLGKKAEIEASKLERRKQRKEKEKKIEKRQEAIEEEELKIEKELFDKQGYYVPPVGEVILIKLAFGLGRSHRKRPSIAC